MSHKNKGFTLIELLVVIAIIGILSSVVLASLNTARQKGNDAKIKAQLSGARAAAEVFYDSNSSAYTGMCTTAAGNPMNPYLVNADYPGAGTVTCFGSGQDYIMSYPLISETGNWCIDNAGAARVRATVPTAATQSC